MAKQILFKENALNKLASGAQQFNDAVVITMGAKGQNVLIEANFGSLPQITKDGVTVAKQVELTDVVENTACTLIKNIALRTNDEVGDGTTTSVSLANAIIQYGKMAIQKDNIHPIMLKRGLDLQLKEVLAELDKYKMDVTDMDTAYQVALVSANGDKNVAQLVTDVYKEVGKEGNIAIEISNKSIDSSYKRVEGINFDRGYNNPYFINNAKGNADYNDVLILITDYVINTANEIGDLLNLVATQNKPLLIICEDIDVRAEEVLINNKLNGVLKPVVVKAPEFGDRRLDFLEDLAILTGGTFVSNLTGITLSEVKEEHLGKAERIIVTEEETTVVGGNGSDTTINDRRELIKERILNAKDEHSKEYLEKRFARINGGVVVIKVGGYSDFEKSELKDRVEDAVNAVKSSLIDGIIPGGGVPLMRIGEKGFKGSDLSRHSNDINKGKQVLLKAIKVPFRQILLNAGLDPAEISEEINKKHKHTVFDVISETYKNGFNSGIIDPVLVTKTALINAVSIAGTLLTTGCTINYTADNSAPVDFSLPS